MNPLSVIPFGNKFIMHSNEPKNTDDVLSSEQISELRSGIQQHFADSNYEVTFLPLKKDTVTTTDFGFHLCRKWKDGTQWMVPCPIFLNLQMYAQLLQSGEFAFFLETMEEMMWGVGQYNQKLSHIICDSIFGGKEKSWFEGYKSKCMPALDYSYLILDEDLDRLHTMDEIEIYNKRLKAFFAGMFGLQKINLHKPTKEEHLEEIVFDCTLKNKHLKYTYREFLGQMLKKESFHQWIVQAQADC